MANQPERAQKLSEEKVESIYSNSMALSISPFDVSLTFAERSGADVTPKVRVIMSLEHALVMLMVAKRSLREHVKRTGVEIRIPPEVMHDLQLDEEDELWS